jgi:hypothetical protein
MGIWQTLLKTEQNIRKRVESAFGKESVQTPLEVRREILEQVESGIIIDTSGKIFPFAKVIIWLQPPTEILQEVFKTAFLQDNSLKMDILQMLAEGQANPLKELEVVVNFQPQLDSDPKDSSACPIFKVEFFKPDPSQKREVPETSFVISKGSAEQAGRLPEVLDREGRMIRRNDIVILDNGDEINSTVGRAHARIWFESDRQEFRVMDEVSRYGTLIVREGRSIEVPAGNPRGIRLKSGDEIYCGRVCLRFELVSIS